MPTAQAMVVELNKRFTGPALRQLQANMFAPGADLAALALKNGVAQNAFETGVIAAIPKGIQEMLRALIFDNLKRDTRLSITWAWAPGYDYELQTWECPGTAVSPGGITILLRTRYPLDEHPSSLGTRPRRARRAGGKPAVAARRRGGR